MGFHLTLAEACLASSRYTEQAGLIKPYDSYDAQIIDSVQQEHHKWAIECKKIICGGWNSLSRSVISSIAIIIPTITIALAALITPTESNATTETQNASTKTEETTDNIQISVPTTVPCTIDAKGRITAPDASAWKIQNLSPTPSRSTR